MTCSKEKGDIRHHKTPGLGQIHSASIKGHAVPIHTGAKSKIILFHLGGTTTTRMEIIKYSLVNRRVRSKRCGCCLKTMKSEQEGKCFISNNRHAGRVKREERERKEDAGA